MLVGGVSELYQGDLDLGRRVVERLGEEDIGRDVVVEDLHYGAIGVAQRLEDVAPEALVLVGAERRGRDPGTVERRRIGRLDLDDDDVQAAVSDAATGYVGIELVVRVAAGLGVLPERTVALEFEPVRTAPTESLSDQAASALDGLVGRVRDEVRRLPVLALGDRLRAVLTAEGRRMEPTPALEALGALLQELETLDREGRWAGVFHQRDVLRARIAAGEAGEDMDKRDWALWWALIEALDGLQRLEVRASHPHA